MAKTSPDSNHSVEGVHETSLLRCSVTEVQRDSLCDSGRVTLNARLIAFLCTHVLYYLPYVLGTGHHLSRYLSTWGSRFRALPIIYVQNWRVSIIDSCVNNVRLLFL